MPKHKVYSAYGKRRKPYNLVCPDPSLAKQSERDICDINKILKKHAQTGIITHTNKFQGTYDDLPTGHDYHSALNKVLEAEESFNSLTSEIRSTFNNDPAKFLEFAQNPANGQQLIDMGLATHAQVDLPATPAPAPPEAGSD